MQALTDKAKLLPKYALN